MSGSRGRFFALQLGEVEVDPSSVKVAQEYQVVYDAELGEDGMPVREPERVPGQFSIYDSIPAWTDTARCGSSSLVAIPMP